MRLKLFVFVAAQHFFKKIKMEKQLLKALARYVKESNQVVQIKYKVKEIHYTTTMDPRNLDLENATKPACREELLHLASALATEVGYVVNLNFKRENVEIFCKPRILD